MLQAIERRVGAQRGSGEESGREQDKCKELSGVELCFMTLVCKAVGERRFLRYQS